MPGTRSRLGATVRLAAIVAAVSSIALGGVAATTLLDGAPRGQAVAAGPDRAPADPVSHDPVTVPAVAEPVAPVAAPVSAITPGRNPPLMAVGSSTEQVRELQVRLAHLDLFDADVTGYFGEVTKGAVAAYQTSQGVEATGEIYPDLWASLQSQTPTPTEEELYPPPPVAEPPTIDPAGLDSRCLTGRVLCIDKSDQALRWVVNGRIVLEMDARFGRPGLETREGQFSVYWKDRDHVSSIYESQMPYAMFFSGGQAVHYSGEFASIGYTGAGSHGCVNIRDRDGIAWLFDQVRTGDKVIVYWS